MANSNTAALVLGGGVILAGGYFFWDQQRKKREFEQALSQLPREQQMSLKDALIQGGKGACMAAGMKYKIPPDVSGPICQAGSQLVYWWWTKGMPAIGKAMGKGIVKGAKAVGKGARVVGKTALKVGQYLPPVIVAKAGLKVAKVGVKAGKKGVKAGVKVAKKAGKLVKYAPPVIVGKVAVKGVKAAGKAVGKVGKWLGLGDADQDLVGYAMMGMAGRRMALQAARRTPGATIAAAVQASRATVFSSSRMGSRRSGRVAAAMRARGLASAGCDGPCGCRPCVGKGKKGPHTPQAGRAFYLAQLG